MFGVVPGTLFLKLGSPWIIKALLGVFIIGLGIEMATRGRAKPHRPNALARTLISFASGFMAGLFGINLLFLAYMERIAENRQQFRTNVCFARSPICTTVCSRFSPCKLPRFLSRRRSSVSLSVAGSTAALMRNARRRRLSSSLSSVVSAFS